MSSLDWYIAVWAVEIAVLLASTTVTVRVTTLFMVVLALAPFRTVGVPPPPAMLIVTNPPELLYMAALLEASAPYPAKVFPVKV